MSRFTKIIVRASTKHKKSLWLGLTCGIIILSLSYILYWPIPSIIRVGTNHTNDLANIRVLEIHSPIVPVPTSAHAEHEYSQIYSNKFIAAKDFWITATAGKVNNGPPDILHHSILFIERGEDNPITYIDAKNKRILSAEKKFPKGFGVFIEKGTVLTLQTMFHNATETTYSGVSFTLKLGILYPRDVPDNMKRIDVFLVDIRNEKEKEYFTVPPHVKEYIRTSGENNFSTSKFTSPVDGDIIMLHPHYHVGEGGMLLSVFLNAKKLFDFFPLKNNGAETESLLPLLSGEPAILTVQKGDTLTVSVHYKNQASLPVTDAMGQLWIYFSPRNKVTR